MEDSRLVKEVVLGEMEWKTTKGRQRKELPEDIREWYNEEINVLKRNAQDRDTWQQVVERALDTNVR